MRLVYTHENRILVGNIKNILEGHRIEVMLKNEFAQSAVGELPPIDAWLELWIVDERDFNNAKRLIAEALAGADGPDWDCPACGEVNGALFEVCWQCQSEPSPEQLKLKQENIEQRSSITTGERWF